MKMKTKLFAFLAVALMMALPLAAFVPSADADSDSNDSIDRIDDIADLQPIDLPEGFENGLEDGDAMLLGDTRATGVLEGMYPGSWTWDRTTGIGPYNSFYGAFDIDDGNRFVGVLDPYNLKQLVDGTPLSETGHFNIMWVLPTVYWSVDANGNLELSNDPAKGTAYAHTIDGHVYKYIAYGVYEATPNDDGTAPTAITSESGKTPLASVQNSAFYRLASSDLSGNLGAGSWSMMWNYYQYQLYKFITLTMMEDFNSQEIVGIGKGGSLRYAETGLLDNYGPYAGKTGSYTDANADSPVKLLLENSWGSKSEFLSGIWVDITNSKIYIDSSHLPVLGTTSGDYLTVINDVTLVNNVYPVEISTDENIWGLGITGSGTNSTGIADYNKRSSSGLKYVQMGGFFAASSFIPQCGINYFEATFSANANSFDYSTRLAFVFDQDPMIFTPASYDYKLNYDPTLMTTTSAAISVDGMDPITHTFPTYTISVASDNIEFGTVDVSELTDIQWGTTVTVEGNTLTIGETVITATPAEGYRLASWSVANGDVITSDTTITATFELIPVPEPVENKLVKLIPLIVIIALTVIAAMALMSFTGNGIDLIKLLIGLTVCVLFVAMAMIPAVGGF